MKKIVSSFWVRIKIISKFLWNHLDRLINLIVLVISMYALKIAIDANNNQVKQFDENSKSSDKLFNVQLKNSRELNDSLIAQIKSLQSITNKQLKITDEQLIISKLNYSEQTLLGRPRISIEDIKIEDTVSTTLKTITYKITYSYKNSGYRTALNLANRTFLTETDTVDYHQAKLKSISLEPMQSYRSEYVTSIKIKDSENFYILIEFSFYDEFTKRELVNFYYFHYNNHFGENDFYFCKDYEITSLRDFINRQLSFNKEPLLKNEDN